MADPTFFTIRDDLRRLLDRDPVTDVDYVAQEPIIFRNAELRIARELNPIVDQVYVSGVMTPGNAFLPRSSRTTSTQFLEITLPSTQTAQIEFRPIAWLQKWWNQPLVTGQPRFAAVYDDDNIRVTPPPDLPYPWVQANRRHTLFLDDAHLTNEYVQTYPDLLFYACAVEAAIYAQEDRRNDLFNTYNAMFDRRKAAIIGSEQTASQTASETGPERERSP
jgi:hypothetical protein